MKFQILATIALVGSQAIKINSAFDKDGDRAVYHDDYDNQLPSKKELDEAIANGTLPNTTAGATANSVNCSAFMNASLADLDTNFTGLLKNFTDARAPVALKAGNQTVNATQNPYFVNATLFDAAELTNLTKHMKNVTDFLV